MKKTHTPLSNLHKEKEIAPSVDGKLASTPHDRRLAIGAVLTFYRLIQEIGRTELAKRSGVSVSLLGMIENGVRLPTFEALGRIGVNLQLTDEQRLQLNAMAGYSLSNVPEAPGWEVLPEDVLNGKPIFVRDMKLETAFQDELDLDEVWMITRRPMALHEPILGWLKGKLLNTRTRYVYFVDRRTGEEDFEMLRFRLNLEVEPGWVAKEAARETAGAPPQLVFVLSPPALCIATHTLAIFNPLSKTKRTFGRTAIYQGENPVGVYAMDKALTDEVISFLTEPYIDLRDRGELSPRALETYGTLSLISSDTLKQSIGR